MINLIKYLPLLGLSMLLLTCCQKENASPKEELPAATMNGSNTFGAVVNGKVWVPKGRPSTFQSNFDVVYDPGYKGGSFDIRAYRVINNSGSYEHFYIYMTQLDHEGIYNLGNSEVGTVTFETEDCVYEREDKVKGTLEITKLDLTNGIIAGKFEFTLARPGCDTIRVTDGRFDKKIF